MGAGARARALAGSAAASREAPPLWNPPGCDVAAIPSSPAGLHTAEEAARARAVNPAARRPWGGRGCRSAPAEARTAGRLPDVRSRGSAGRQTLRMLGKTCGAKAGHGRKEVLGAGVGLPRRETLQGVGSAKIPSKAKQLELHRPLL